MKNLLLVIMLACTSRIYTGAIPYPQSINLNFPAFIWEQTIVCDNYAGFTNAYFPLFYGGNWFMLYHPDIKVYYAYINTDIATWSDESVMKFRFNLSRLKIDSDNVYINDLSEWTYIPDLKWCYWAEKNNFHFVFNNSFVSFKKNFNGTGAPGGWFWSENYGWGWTAEGIYPWVWSLDESDWIWVRKENAE